VANNALRGAVQVKQTRSAFHQLCILQGNAGGSGIGALPIGGVGAPASLLGKVIIPKTTTIPRLSATHELPDDAIRTLPIRADHIHSFASSVARPILCLGAFA
jgi:hypothetical protein